MQRVAQKAQSAEGEHKSRMYKLVSIARVITGCENSITVSRVDRADHVRRELTRAGRFWSTSQSIVIARGNVGSGEPFLGR